MHESCHSRRVFWAGQADLGARFHDFIPAGGIAKTQAAFRLARSQLLAIALAALLGCSARPAAPFSAKPSREPQVIIPDATYAEEGAPLRTQPVATTRPVTDGFDMKQAVEYLASDALEGRGVGTPGLNLAADFVAGKFQSFGLNPLPGIPGYFQSFNMVTTVKPDPGCTLAFGDTKYALDKDFNPASFSAEGTFDAPMIFVGYGVSSKSFQYDDFAGADLKGKIALAMRFEPHNADGHSRFAKDDWSTEATLTRKAKVAADHGALALLLVNPPTYHPGDSLMPFSMMMPGEKAPIPVIQVKESIVDGWLSNSVHKDLKTLQAQIDETAKPQTQELPGLNLSGKISIRREEHEVKNVVAVLPGSGPRAQECVVIGAHYDHLGHGGPGSLAPGSHAIFSGADDNASGTVAMLKLAEHYARLGPQPRTLVFAAWTAEEEGLIGSQHFVSHPPIALDHVVAMLNLDMVGRVRNHTLYVGGAGTAPSFDNLLATAGAGSGLELKSIGRGGYGPSDHMSFAMKKVPVLFLFSGIHSDYHRPSDKADKINYAGMDEAVAFSTRVIDAMERMPHEQYVSASDASGMHMGGPGGSRVTLGVVPDYSGDDSTKGVRITGTVPGSPAAAAGLQEGDVIVRFDNDPVDTLMQLADELSKGKPGAKVKVGILRNHKPMEIEATLAERKG